MRQVLDEIQYTEIIRSFDPIINHCGTKEVPVIKMSVYKNNKLIKQFIFDSLFSFNIDYNCGVQKYKFMEFVLATMDPNDLDELLNNDYDRFGVERYEVWKIPEKECFFITDEEFFDALNICYEVTTKGEPARWTLTLTKRD